MPLTSDPWLLYDSDGSVPACRLAAPVAVYRFDGVSSLFALPNVECTGISIREGTDPGSASFRYNLASGLTGAPTSIETALGSEYDSPLTINPGDRLVVQAQQPSGTVVCLFDGLAIDFGLGIDPELEEVEIGCVGIAWHCWDDVIPGALMRNAGAARVVADTPTDLPAQFNPSGLPNCTPDGYMAGSMSGGHDYRYPTFLDPTVIQQPTDARTYWSVNKALRYLIFNGNPTQQYVTNPDGGYLDGLLLSPGNLGDTPRPIPCPDTPITGKDWPGTVNRLVGESGFGTVFALGTSGAGLPVTSFNVFASQAGPVKQLYLYPRGTAFDARLFNVGSSRLHRDLADVVNQQTVSGGLDRWEASFILAPGFPMVATDGAPANLKSYDRDNAANASIYRNYIFDETSDGHYAIGTNTPIALATSLDGLFGAPISGLPNYVRRRRPGIGKLISVDPLTNLPYEARLAISANYTGPSPGLWDGSGTWQNITSTTWRLLSDRLGIAITDDNPNRWEIGQGTNFLSAFFFGVVRGVENQCALVTGKSFTLRLTCVVESDQALTQIALPRGSSPLSQTINRQIDASDRYHNEYIDYPSELNNASGGANQNPRNDNKAALAEAQALRASTEAGVLEGPVMIPRLTTYYQIGDLISEIEGRNLGLRTDNGSDTPIYPVVVGVHYQFGDDSQTTALELSDAGTHRTRYARSSGRPPHVKRRLPPLRQPVAKAAESFGGFTPSPSAPSGSPAPGESFGGFSTTPGGGGGGYARAEPPGLKPGTLRSKRYS